MIVKRTAEALATGIREMLVNEAVAKQFSSMGQRLVAEKLSITKVVDRLEQIYLGNYVDLTTNDKWALSS
jgi:hypothetical protein